MPHSRAPAPRRFPTYPICSERIYEKKNTAAGNLFGGFVCLYGDEHARQVNEARPRADEWKSAPRWLRSNHLGNPTAGLPPMQIPPFCGRWSRERDFPGGMAGFFDKAAQGGHRQDYAPTLHRVVVCVPHGKFGQAEISRRAAVYAASALIDDVAQKYGIACRTYRGSYRVRANYGKMGSFRVDRISDLNTMHYKRREEPVQKKRR